MADSDDTRSPSRRDGSRCGGCGQSATRLRRGLCAGCYARWVRARPVGIGAACAACNDRRLEHLRHYELRGLWVVMCHNCCACAERVAPSARSLDALLTALRRERRVVGERRSASQIYWADAIERRKSERRATDRPIDATELIIEIEADYAGPTEGRDPDGEPITAVHGKLDAGDL